MSEKLTAQVRCSNYIKVSYTQAVLDELMSDDWQSSFYHFSTTDDAICWLAWVVNELSGPERVDGLAHLTENDVTVDVIDRESEIW